MKAIQVGGVSFTDNRTATDPYIIGMFGAEGTGKTRFALTGPGIIGFVPLEMKTYKTIKKDAPLLGKQVLLPLEPSSLIVNIRRSTMLEVQAKSAKSDKDKEAADLVFRQYYRDFVDRIKDVTYALLENKDVRLVAIDTFGQMCQLIDCAIYGFTDRFIKVQGKIYKDRKEYNQEVIDFLNSLSGFQKPVLLTHKRKDEYGASGNLTGRGTWEGFRFLGNHCNVMIELENNKKWNPEVDDPDRQWHFGLNIRACQDNPVLEGPDGNPLLRDEMVGFPSLIQTIDPEVDLDTIM